LKVAILDILKQHLTVMYAELQQRAIEYVNLTKFPKLMNAVWEIMPPFPDEQVEPGSNKVVEEKSQEEPKTQATPLIQVEQKPPPTTTTVPVVSTPVVPQYIAPTLTPKNRDAFNRLCLIPEGILYEDQYLQIGVRTSYQQAFGRLMLYFGNVTNYNLDNFVTKIPPITHISVQTQSLPQNVAAGVQVQQAIAVTCNNEFKDPPTISASFVTPQGPVTLNLSLPIICTKFVEPLNLSKEDFAYRWRQINGAPLEAMSIIKAAKVPLDLTFISKIISTGFRLAILTTVDPNPFNLVAAGTFFSSSKQVVCLVRIEGNPQVNCFRLTVKTFHEGITEILKGLLQAQLGEEIPTQPNASS